MMTVRMSRRAKLAVMAVLGSGALASGLLVTALHHDGIRSHHAAVGSRSAEATRGRPATVAAVTSTIVIDPETGETFAPPPVNAAPALTAAQAYAREMTVENSPTAIPSHVTAQLGVLTLPRGETAPDGSTTELAYGFSWHSCMVTLNGWVPPTDPCIEWDWVDANTGQMIDDTWQAPPGGW